MSSADAMKAREKLNGTVVDGRKIEVLELYQAFVFFFKLFSFRCCFLIC